MQYLDNPASLPFLIVCRIFLSSLLLTEYSKENKIYKEGIPKYTILFRTNTMFIVLARSV